MKNNIDSQVDETLEKCILSTPRKSFFLFAGAGSGKTHSLVLLLKKIRNSIGKDLLLQGKNVAVITFTNAATDEIINRLDYSPIFHISTIHSFVWDIIRYYQTDIKRLYCQYIIEDAEVLEKKLDATQNKATKTYFSNVEKLEYLKERLIKAQTIDKFVYNPNGSNPDIIRKSRFSPNPKRSVRILGFCIKRSVQKTANAQHKNAAFSSCIFMLSNRFQRA